MNDPRVGVAAMIWRDGKILLVQRKGVHGAGTWSTPGGHLEYGETPEQCAIRETQEEVGVTLTDVHFVALTNDVFEETHRHYITIWMAGTILSGEPTVAAEEESTAVGWFAPDALPEPLFLPFLNLLNQKGYPENRGFF